MLCKHMESSQHWNKFPTLEPIFQERGEIQVITEFLWAFYSIKRQYKLNPQCKHHKAEVRATFQVSSFKSSARFCAWSFQWERIQWTINRNIINVSLRLLSFSHQWVSASLSFQWEENSKLNHQTKDHKRWAQSYGQFKAFLLGVCFATYNKLSTLE